MHNQPPSLAGLPLAGLPPGQIAHLIIALQAHHGAPRLIFLVEHISCLGAAAAIGGTN